MSRNLALVFWLIYPILLALLGRMVLLIPFFKKRQVKVVDVMVPFLFIGLHYLSVMLYQHSLIPYMLLSMMLMGMIITIGQAYFFQYIDYKKFFKMYWRLIFVFQIISYLVLILFLLWELFTS